MDEIIQLVVAAVVGYIAILIVMTAITGEECC